MFALVTACSHQSHVISDLRQTLISEILYCKSVSCSLGRKSLFSNFEIPKFNKNFDNYLNIIYHRVKDAALKSDKMFVSEKKLADLLIKISTSLSALGTSENTDLDKYVDNFFERWGLLSQSSAPSFILCVRITFGISVNDFPFDVSVNYFTINFMVERNRDLLPVS